MLPWWSLLRPRFRLQIMLAFPLHQARFLSVEQSHFAIFLNTVWIFNDDCHKKVGNGLGQKSKLNSRAELGRMRAELQTGATSLHHLRNVAVPKRVIIRRQPFGHRTHTAKMTSVHKFYFQFHVAADLLVMPSWLQQRLRKIKYFYCHARMNEWALFPAAGRGEVPETMYIRKFSYLATLTANMGSAPLPYAHCVIPCYFSLELL